uniref:Piwi domain-containing protein n=1 Tax=Panagrolaimus superbus TaxID=310955 RepID=A0A914Y5N9_9BILA
MYRKESNIQVDRDQKYVIKEGVQKGARAIATETGGSSELMLQIDSKKAAFYTGLNLVQFIFESNYNWREHDIENSANWKKIIGQLRNLAVETIHLEKNRKFNVAAITKYSAADSFFPLKEGGEMSVAQYYAKKNRPLKFPNFPCIMESKNNKSSLFPLELLKVMDGQRVPLNKIPGTLTQFMIRQCQQKPADLTQQIISEADQLEFHNSNEWLKRAGIRFVESQKFVKTQAKELPPPAINYGNKQLQLQSSLAIIARDTHTAKNFGERIVTMSKQLGMLIDQWNPIELYTENDTTAIEELCNNLMKRNYTFLFFIADSAQVHSSIKFAEIHDKIPTQQMKIESTKKGADTTKNIIMKFNAKAGGKNHAIVSNPGLKTKEGGIETVDFVQSILQTALVIGLEMSHPPKVRIDQFSKVQGHEPTCVGIAGTIDRNANCQSGGYFYQNGGSFIIDAQKLSEKVIDMIKEYFLRNQFYPSYLIIYRSGLSEGQFAEVDDKECQVMKKIIFSFYEQLMLPPPKISVIAVQRKTNYRLFKPVKDLEQYIGSKTPAFIQNVTPGTTITQRGTNPECKEFIMVAQKALLGTAKPIVGTVIFDYPPFSTNIEQIANLSNSLCYMHEICTSAISIPAPLKSAEQLAKRGKNNWVHWLKKSNVEDDTSSVASSIKQLTKEDVENFKAQASAWFDDLSKDLQVVIKSKFWA